MNQLAKRIVDEATGEAEPRKKFEEKAPKGSAGGQKRSNNMTKDQRIDAARVAALARWKKTD
jgi:hypothetical protein